MRGKECFVSLDRVKKEEKDVVKEKEEMVVVEEEEEKEGGGKKERFRLCSTMFSSRPWPCAFHHGIPLPRPALAML